MTGAGAPRQAAAKPSSSFRGACAATPELRLRIKKPARAGFFAFERLRSLDLRFFVDDVLARHRIVFLHLDLLRRGALVLRRRIEVTRACRGFQLDLLTHV